MNTTANTMNANTKTLLFDVIKARRTLHETKWAVLNAQTALDKERAAGLRGSVAIALEELRVAEAAHARAEAGWFSAMEAALVEAPTNLEARVSVIA